MKNIFNRHVLEYVQMCACSSVDTNNYVRIWIAIERECHCQCHCQSQGECIEMF